MADYLTFNLGFWKSKQFPYGKTSDTDVHQGAGGILLEKRVFWPHSFSHDLLPGRKGIAAAAGLSHASVWHPCRALDPHGAVWSHRELWDQRSHSRFTKRELKQAQRVEVTFPKRSQWRHILKPGLWLQSFSLYPQTSISQLFYFVLPVLSFGEHAISRSQELHTCCVEMVPQPSFRSPH